MKKLSLLIAVVMMVSLMNVPVFAEASHMHILEENPVIVEASGDQVALEARIKPIIEVDGLKFKDLNANGKLDVYEDWRQDVNARVEDLLAQMTMDEIVATLMNNTTGGTFTSLFPYPDEWMWSDEERINIDGLGYTPIYHSIVEDHVTTYLLNGNGTAADQIKETNSIQLIAESARLGIPVVLNSDRSYQTFAGMVDMAKYAFGVAHDEQLLYDLAHEYALEERAMGYHVPFQPQGSEIGAFYGEDVNYLAKMIAVEVKAKYDAGQTACSKHFISNGNHNSNYSGTRSPADLIDSWLVGWKSSLNAGTQWIMAHNGEGRTRGIIGPYDAETLGILRNDLGYDGIIVTDWPLFLTSPTANGITADGKDLSQMTPGELYTQMLEAGIDLFGGYIVLSGTDTTIMDETNSNFSFGAGGPTFVLTNWPDVIKAEVEAGRCDKELVLRSCRRVLRNKFELGLFENPYAHLEDVLNLFASDAYLAEQFPIASIDDVYAARKDSLNELEERLQTESTVLLKNDGGILPLTKGTKVYVTGTSDATAELDRAAIGAYAEIVDSPEEADVIVARVADMKDSTEMIVEDAKEAGKPLILAAQAGNAENEISTFAAEGSAAILMLTYNNTPDHGSSMGSFFSYTLPRILADMIFGEREPSGNLVFEIGRTEEDNLLDWGELGLDRGVDNRTRLYMAGMVRQNPEVQLPSNLGDVLFPCGFGMRYGSAPDIRLSTLVVPQVAGDRTAVNAVQKSGVPFEVDILAENAGAAGNIQVCVYDGETLLATKLVSVAGGSFCVVPLEITLEGAGDHTISVDGITAVITVE